MPIPTFPTLPAPAFEIPVDTENPALRSAFEDGNVQTRSKYTKQRRTWSLTWPGMSKANKETLHAFYLTTKGGSQAFTWTDTEASANVVVRFISFKETQRTTGRWAVSVQLEEV